MALGSGKNERDRKKDGVTHIGMPAIRKQLHRRVPYVPTPWLAPFRRIPHHDAIGLHDAYCLAGQACQER